MLIEFYGLTKEEVRRPVRWRKERRQPGGKLVRARIATCLSTKSLRRRGLLEATRVRGWWQLSTRGRKIAARLWPELKPPARRELLPKLKEAYLDRIKRECLSPQTDFKSFVRDCFRPGVKIDGF